MRLEKGFDPVRAAKALLRESRSGALATLMGDGAPYCSLVNVATEPDGSPLLLVSRLAVHTKNLLADPRVSLMLDERKPGDPLEGVRIMLTGRASPAGSDTAARRYLARHPDAAGYAGFSDFAYYRIDLAGCHLVAGFGRIVDLTAAQLLTPADNAASLVAAEDDICAHLNSDHRETLRLYATRLRGAPDGDWTCVGCDPEGIELQHEQTALRIAFPESASTPTAVRKALKTLAERARAEPPTQ